MCIDGRASATMGAMNKRELAKAVAVQADVELKTVVSVIDGFTDVVTAVVSKGEPVSIPGFAKFVKVNRAARMGRNPATGEAIRIKASKKARITPVKAFKDAVLAPATAPKLVKGAYPTSDAAVAAAGKSAAPVAAKKAPARAAAKKAPARRTTARKAPAKRAPAKKAVEAGARQEGREKVASKAGPLTRDRPSAAQVQWASHATRWKRPIRRLPLPKHWLSGPSRSRIPTGCRRTIRPSRRSSAGTPTPWPPVRTPTWTQARDSPSSRRPISLDGATAASQAAGTARTSRDAARPVRHTRGVPGPVCSWRHSGADEWVTT